MLWGGGKLLDQPFEVSLDYLNVWFTGCKLGFANRNAVRGIVNASLQRPKTYNAPNSWLHSEEPRSHGFLQGNRPSYPARCERDNVHGRRRRLDEGSLVIVVLSWAAGFTIEAAANASDRIAELRPFWILCVLRLMHVNLHTPKLWFFPLCLGGVRERGQTDTLQLRRPRYDGRCSLPPYQATLSLLAC